MKIIDKLSECEDKLLDPRTLSFRMKHVLRRRINDLLSAAAGDRGSDTSTGGHGDAAADVKTKLVASLEEILDRDQDQKERLSYDDVSQVHQILQRLDPTYDLFFHQLLDQCRAYDEKERTNKELEARLKKLQFDLGNKSYREMTRTIIEPRTAGAAAASVSDIGAEVRQLRPLLITLINSVMVIGATFLFVFKAVEYSMSKPDVIVQVVASLTAATIVAVAELYFLLKVI